MFEDFRLKVFRAVLEQGSFTRAARQLGISQPAVSQHVAELEKSAGAELFTRSRGAVTLTSAGIAFKEYADKILYWYAAASGMFGEEGRLTRRRPVRISSDSFASVFLLPKAVAALRAAHPALLFCLEPDPPEDPCDARVFCRRHAADLSLADSAALLGGVPAGAIAPAVLPACSAMRTLGDLPPETRFVVWRPYVPLLPPDLSARTAVEAFSPGAVLETVTAAADLVGLLPAAAAGPSVRRLPADLESLRFDLHFQASEEFSRTDACALVRKTLLDLLGS